MPPAAQHILLWSALDPGSAVDLTGAVPDWAGVPVPTAIDDYGNIAVCVNAAGPSHGYLLTKTIPEIVGPQVTTSLQPRAERSRVRSACQLHGHRRLLGVLERQLPFHAGA